MKKVVYSLVLSEDVVREVDKLAYAMNTNRSNMINQILAEYVSYVTPEQRMHHLMEQIRSHFIESAVFQLPAASSSSMVNLRTALSYKYNPTVRYSVELSRAGLPEIGTLRVSLRTQNAALIMEMMRFYRLWDAVEQRLLGEQQSAIEDERYARRLRLQSPAAGHDIAVGSEELGQLIADYIAAFDTALKRWFSHRESPEAFAEELTRIYREYLAERTIAI